MAERGEAAVDLRADGAILLVSCYELGHAPLALASPLGFLERAGFAPRALDCAVEALDEAAVARARLVAISTPMHTALRLGVRAARRVRELNPPARVVLYGLYAGLNAEWLLADVADAVVAGEVEAPLVALAEAFEREDAAGSALLARTPISGVRRRGEPPGPPHLARLDFAAPSRARLPALERYARLDRDDANSSDDRAHSRAVALRAICEQGEGAVAGYVEASRGCLHLCRHCPIPPVYGGRFFTVPREVVLADIRAQVEAGAEHITFGDPDFLNGPGHALRIARSLHDEHPRVSFDFTAKVEHLLRDRALLPEFARLGCAFVTTAVESLSAEVLERLAKGHTREGAEAALALVRAAGIALRPTLVPFTPWETLEGYLAILAWIERADLERDVDPVQLSIRLLVPPGSLLLEDATLRPRLRGLDEAALAWRWTHPDPRMDALARAVAERVAAAAATSEDAAETHAAVRRLALEAAGRAAEARAPAPRPRERRPSPRLTEPWFC